jgi:sugar phosphate isomerase/epimerase
MPADDGLHTALLEGGESALRTREDIKTCVRALAVTCRSTRREEAVSEVTHGLEFARKLEALCLNVTVAPLRGPAAPDGFARYQDALNFAYTLMDEVSWNAQCAGVAVALEVGAGGCFLSPVECRELIDRANAWAVGACVDTERMAAFGSPVDWLATLGRRVHCLRLGSRCAGDEALFSVLPEVGFPGVLVLPADANPNHLRGRLPLCPTTNFVMKLKGSETASGEELA